MRDALRSGRRWETATAVNSPRPAPARVAHAHPALVGERELQHVETVDELALRHRELRRRRFTSVEQIAAKIGAGGASAGILPSCRSRSGKKKRLKRSGATTARRDRPCNGQRRSQNPPAACQRPGSLPLRQHSKIDCTGTSTARRQWTRSVLPREVGWRQPNCLYRSGREALIGREVCPFAVKVRANVLAVTGISPALRPSVKRSGAVAVSAAAGY